MSVHLDMEYLKAHDWWSRVKVGEPAECWPWLLSIGSHGYGQTWDGQHVTTAHRVAWVLSRRTQVPDDLVIDHICGNRVCCNPAHLQLLEMEVNAALNSHSLKVACLRGHPYDDVNTYINGRGHRICRACAKLRKAVRVA